MKKYISLFITLIVLSLVLSVSTSAVTVEKTVTFSEDYKNLYFNGSTYIRVDTDMLYYISYDQSITDDYTKSFGAYYVECPPLPVNYENYYTIKLTDEQHKEIEMIEIDDVSQTENIFIVTIYFLDGSEFYIGFLREDLLEEYNELVNGNSPKYTIDFMWPDGNEATIEKEKFFIGKKTKIDIWDYDEEFYVYAKSEKCGFDAEIGVLHSKDGKYYFFDYNDLGIKSDEELTNIGNYEIEAVELTDKEMLENIQAGEEKYYEDDYGYIYNDELTERVSKIFYTILFAVFPAIIFIVSLILAIKSKKALYKKLLFATCGISIAEIITFIYIAFTLFNN